MIQWNEPIVKRLVELVTDPVQLSQASIALMLSEEFDLNISRDAVGGKVRTLRETGQFETFAAVPKAEAMPYYNKYLDALEYDEYPEKTLVLKSPYVLRKPEGKVKILYLGDLHIPFEEESQVQLAVNRNASADIVVMAEVSDFYAISRFNKSFSIPLEVEIERILRLFEYMSNTFPLVIVIQGNHGGRVERHISSLPSALAVLIKTSNLLRYLARPFKNVVVVDQWYVEINDAVFAHAEKFSQIDMRSGVKIYEWLSEWKDSIGIDRFSCVVQGHVHQLGVTYRQSCKIFEGGCLCYPPDYAVEKVYPKPQMNGYIVIHQNDGVTDYDLSREYKLGTPRYTPRVNPAGISLDG